MSLCDVFDDELDYSDDCYDEEDDDEYYDEDDEYNEDDHESGTRPSNPLIIKPKMCAHLPVDDMMRELGIAWSNGSRFSDINEDYGIYSRDSYDGGVEHEMVEALNVGGEKWMDEGNYENARDLFTDALKSAVKIKNNGMTLGINFCQRSRAYFMLKEYKKAASDAKTSIRCYPILSLAGVRLTEAYEALRDYKEAFNVCTMGLTIYVMNEEREAQYLKLAVRLSSKVRNGLDRLSEKSHTDSVWSLVVTEFASEEAWGTVRILLMGTDDLTPLVSKCDATKIALSGLVKTCNETMWTQWGQKLILLLIKLGAKHESLCPENKYPFHVALEKALKADSFDLLKWLFANKRPNETILDGSQNSLLHTVCRSKSSSRSTAIRLLINYHIDVSARNSQGKFALDYLNKGDPDCEFIRKQMVKTAEGSVQKPAENLMSTITHAASAAQSLDKPATTTSTKPTEASLPSEPIRQESDASEHTSFEHVQVWTKTKVKKWLQLHNLAQLKPKFREVDGPLLFELKLMQETAPEVFYKVLEESLSLPLMEILKVSSSLRDIDQEDHI